MLDPEMSEEQQTRAARNLVVAFVDRRKGVMLDTNSFLNVVGSFQGDAGEMLGRVIDLASTKPLTDEDFKQVYEQAFAFMTGASAAGRQFGTSRTYQYYFGSRFDSNKYVRPGLEKRTDAEFNKKGQMTDEEYNALIELSKTTDFKWGIAGGHAETRFGINFRANPQTRETLETWRQTGTPKLGDIDVWMEPGVSQEQAQALLSQIGRVFPGKKVDSPRVAGEGYNTTRYPDEESLSRAGAIVFDRGDSRRALGNWQAPQMPKPQPLPVFNPSPTRQDKETETVR
jgi:hypothetical protein